MLLNIPQGTEEPLTPPPRHGTCKEKRHETALQGQRTQVETYGRKVRRRQEADEEEPRGLS